MWPFSSSQYPVISVDQAGTLVDALEERVTANGLVTYDYVIIGGKLKFQVYRVHHTHARVGGTAGCCLASRLSDNPSVSVLVLERGSLNDTWSSRIPLISSDITSKATPVVRFSSLPLNNADGQIVDIVQAETLGGGSAINSMLVTRGAVGDFNHWAELGHPAWSYDALKPYFIKSETALSQSSKDRGHSGLSLSCVQLPR